MKKDKKLLLCAPIVGLVLALTACNDMEQLPENKFTNATFWTSAANAEAMLNTAYSQMYDANRMIRDETLGDNVYDNQNSSTDVRVWHQGYAVGDLRLFSDEWSNDYKTIKSVHMFLAHIDNVDAISEGLKVRMKAEARFIRAYAYMRLALFFGDVPFFTTDITNDEAHTITRTPKNEVVSFIHSELNDIAEQLPTNTELANADRGRVTKAAALLLNARAYMMDNDWANATSRLEQIVNGQAGNYSLFSSYAGLFEVKNEYNPEIILDVSYLEDVRTWNNIQNFGPISAGGTQCNKAILGSLVNNYITLGGYSISDAGADYDPANPYVNRDPRLTATVVYDGHAFNKLKGFGPEVIYTHPNADTKDRYKAGDTQTSPTGFYAAKYFCPPKIGNNSTGINIIMMRHAEVLLSYAEAKIEQAQMDASIWNQTVRLVRQRAGFTASRALDFPADASQEELRRIIRQERRSEFAMEGRRYFDIIRWKVGPECLNGPVYGAHFVESSVDKYVFNDPRSYLYPIPETERSYNPNLTQNPGY